MATANFYAAVYIIIRDQEGKILFGQRKGTGFADGKYQLPAGHMDGNESMIAAGIREAEEEIGVKIRQEDAKIVHISHRISVGREYFDVYMEVSDYEGIPTIKEPHKCSDLAYFDIDSIEWKKFVRFDIDVLRMIESGIAFSELDSKDYME